MEETVKKLKILLVHNEYKIFSGEEAAVAGLESLLKAKGHEVLCFKRSSASLRDSFYGKIKACAAGIYNPFAVNAFIKTVKTFKPDIIHVHNLFPLISPSIIPAAKKLGVPVVMTVHNYRLICPNGRYFNNNKICEKCNGGREWNCIINNCEKAIFKSIGYAVRNFTARITGSYKNNVDRFICLTEFQKNKLLREGFSDARCSVIPNFCLGSEVNSLDRKTGNYAGFVGRVTVDKGINILLKAAQECPEINIKIAGSVDYSFLRGLKIPPNVTFLGCLNKKELVQFYKEARFLVLPSIWYEGFPIVILESMAFKVPIIASRIGGIPEIIEDGVTGLLFNPGDSVDLALKLKWMFENENACIQMGKNARKEFEEKYTAGKNYEILMNIYKAVMSKTNSQLSYG